MKQEIIDQVLLQNQSITSMAIRYGLLSPGMLVVWIRSYKTNGYMEKERKPSFKANQSEKKYEKMTLEEKIEYFEKGLYI